MVFIIFFFWPVFSILFYYLRQLNHAAHEDQCPTCLMTMYTSCLHQMAISSVIAATAVSPFHLFSYSLFLVFCILYFLFLYCQQSLFSILSDHIFFIVYNFFYSFLYFLFLFLFLFYSHFSFLFSYLHYLRQLSA